MKSLAHILTSLVLATWIVAIAILSLKNVTPVSLKFLTFQSIELPFFLVLAFSASVGMIGMALTQPLWSLAGSSEGNSQSENDVDDDEFFSEDEDR